jgi:ATP-dependent Clp protease ATP-binding subunit ClpB
MRFNNKNIGIRLAPHESDPASLMKTERIHAEAELSALFPRLGIEQVVSGFSHFFARSLGVILALCLLTFGSALADPPEGDTKTADYNLDFHVAELKAALDDAETLCRNKGVREIRPVHLFLAMNRLATIHEGKLTDTIFKQLSLADATAMNHLEAMTESAFSKNARELPADAEVTFSPELKTLLKGAERERQLRQGEVSGGNTVTPGHILLAALHDPNSEIGKHLKDMGISRHNILKASRLPETSDDGSVDPAKKSILDEFTINYSERARKGKFAPVIGRSREVRLARSILRNKVQNSPLMIGEAGVGKTAIVEELAKVMTDVEILELKLSFLTAGSKYRGTLEERVKAIIKEVSDRNEAALRGEGKPVILFIDEIHLLNTDDYAGIAQHLKPPLARGELPCIGATTLAEFPILEKDSALKSRFKEFVVDEPNRDQSFYIMQKIAPNFEAFHKVSVTEEALLASVDLTSQYIHDEKRPRVSIKALDTAMGIASLDREFLAHNDGMVPAELESLREHVDTLENMRNVFQHRVDSGNSSAQTELDDYNEKLAIARPRLEIMEELWEKGIVAWRALEAVQKQPASTELEKAAKQAKIKELVLEVRAIHSKFPFFPLDVDEIDINRTVMQMAKMVSISGVLESREERLTRMNGRIDERFVGQPAAKEAISDAVTKLINGESGVRRPVETHLYYGVKSGGASVAPKVIEELGVVRQGHSIEIDLAEYSDKEALTSLLGSRPGYQGEGPGLLTEFVRMHPRSVVYFKNAESAATEVMAMIGTILEKGELTDQKTKANVSFTGTVVIVSTSSGAEIALDPNLTAEQKSEKVMELLMRGVSRDNGRTVIKFNPSAFDKTIYFDSLTEADLKEIFKRMVEALSDEEYGSSRFRVTLTEAAQRKFHDIIEKHGVNSAENAKFVENLVRQNIEAAKTQLVRMYPTTRLSHIVIDYQESDDTLHFGTPQTVKEAEKTSPIIIPAQGEEVPPKDPCARGFALIAGGRKFQTPKSTKYQAKTGEPERPQGLADMANQLERMPGQRQRVGEQPAGSSIIQAPAGSRFGPDGTLLGADGKPLQL